MFTPSNDGVCKMNKFSEPPLKTRWRPLQTCFGDSGGPPPTPLTPYEYEMRRALYSVSATADFLSTSRPGVYGLAKAGRLSLLKLGPKKSRISAIDIARLLNELRGAPAER
jgi:hypothetical protein